MTNWNEFVPDQIEYDFESDKLHFHGLTIDEAVECFYMPYSIRKNKKYKDRFKILGKTDSGRSICIIFQLKNKKTIRIITGWEI
jgi:uncharacterized DUF497 family protein